MTSTQSLGWRAKLSLGFSARRGETVLAHRAHEGPLRVQKPLYPEGRALAHVVILHPPAGIAGGDQLDIAVNVSAGSHALITTPGATKWYRSEGFPAKQTTQINIASGGILEWLPQENIFFDRSHAHQTTDIHLDEGARFIGFETLCFGRRASGERYADGQLSLSTQLSTPAGPLWLERGRISGRDRTMTSPVGLNGRTVCSTLLVAGIEISKELRASCQGINTTEPQGQCSISVLPSLLVARYLGDCSQAARHWFLDLWHQLRPEFCGRAAVTPRIWNT